MGKAQKVKSNLELYKAKVKADNEEKINIIKNKNYNSNT